MSRTPQSRPLVQMPRSVAAPDGLALWAPARLHMGFLDLDGGLGRRFGSLGFTLEHPGTRIVAMPAAQLRVTGCDAERALRYLQRAATHFGIPPAGHFHVDATVPAHIGLGSGTQLALALARSLCALYGLTPTALELAHATGRGLRSGIGIAGFEQGGFLVDGGNRGEGVAPVVARADIPDAWSVLLLYDEAATGLHGEAEIEAFRRLPPFTAERAARLCRVTLMQLLPALAESDLDAFGAAVTVVQNECGDHFAPAQGGRFASPRITAVLDGLRDAGVTCLGQSSWGPTGFAVLPDAGHGETMAAWVRQQFADLPVRVEISRGRNRGAELASAEAKVRADAIVALASR